MARCALALMLALAFAGSAPAQVARPVFQEAPLGCFADQGDPQGTNGRDLAGSIWSDAKMTNSLCRSRCGGQGFKYAGTQYSTYCFCGNDYGKFGPSNACTTRCAGNFREFCGGAWANTVFTSTQSPPGTQPPPAPPLSGGQCVITAAATNYQSREVQRWEVAAPTMPGTPGMRTLVWSTSGGGSHTGSSSSTTWTYSGTVSTQINVQKIANGTWVVQPPAVTGTVTSTITPASGMSQTHRGSWTSYGYGAMTAAASATRIDQTRSFPLAAGNSYQQPAAATGGVSCEWHLAL
jgi:hypothetical protein